MMPDEFKYCGTSPRVVKAWEAEVRAAKRRVKRMEGGMVADWRCWCGEPADYKKGTQPYCAEHWRYGEPVDPPAIQRKRKKKERACETS